MAAKEAVTITTPDNLAMTLSVHARGQESDVSVPHPNPSCVDAIIQELKVCHTLWKEDHDQAKQSGLRVTALEE
jgi:hypothetical protein